MAKGKGRPRRKMENRSFIGLGSNIENKLGYIGSALKKLDAHSSVKVEKVSSVYESKAYGNIEQDNFLNCVVEIKTSLSLEELFIFTKEVEHKIGRVKREKWGPREIDLDILFYNDLVFSDEKLNIPHKDVLNRDFVLVPLCEIAPDFEYPGGDKTICNFNQGVLEKNIVRKIEYQFN